MGFSPNIEEGSPFTLDNIPFGVISSSEDLSQRCATAVGKDAIDLKALSHAQFFPDVLITDALSHHDLSKFAALAAETRTATRSLIIEAIKTGKIPQECVLPLSSATMHLPMEVKGYTDFYCSLEHCQNCAVMMPGGKLPDNLLIAPSSYNGRASSVLPSPQKVPRPKGVFWKPGTKEAMYGASQRLDYELEVGYVVSKPVPYGTTLDVKNAPEHIFGFVLLNDWSSRDIQAFEMPPLGPFNSKSFGTTISPWVITLDALNPFACPPKHRTDPFKHLNYPDFDHGTFDIKLSAELIRGGETYPLCTSNLKYLWWTPYQQLTHHASAGCGLKTGDVMGTGTVSGDAVDDHGSKKELACLFEATLGGSQPIKLADGMHLRYLDDGDQVVLNAWCEDQTGKKVLGFGECRGQIMPAVP